MLLILPGFISKRAIVCMRTALFLFMPHWRGERCLSKRFLILYGYHREQKQAYTFMYLKITTIPIYL